MKKVGKITLIAVNCDCPDDAVAALRYSSKDINFGRIVLLSSTDRVYEGVEKIAIPHLSSVLMYNNFMLNLIEYVDDDYILVIQSDGYVVNSDMWTDEFLEYDYIGAPWPDDEEWIQDQSPDKRDIIRKAISKNRIGNGGFSLRSRKFLEYSNQFITCGYLGEDIFLTAINYEKCMESQIKFPPLDLAYRFSYENRCSEFGDDYREPFYFDVNKHFGFHHCNFINGNEILNLKSNEKV